MKKYWLLILALFSVSAYSQKKDKSVFKEYEPGFYQNFIMKDIRHVKAEMNKKDMERRFFMDHSGLELPNDPSLYKSYWHTPPISQGNTGTCWCFSTISMYESEVKRLTGQEIKLSEIYIVYWEYVEKARGFIQKRGNSNFAEGSEGNAVARIMNTHGLVPWDVYNGLVGGRKYHDHNEMFKEMNAFLHSLKKTNAWNEKESLETIKSIMNYYMGTPPEKFEWKGKEVTPTDFQKNILKINPDDYVEILSYKQEPYWENVEYKVPDNWWHSKGYFNVPLDDFMDALKGAVKNGYTISIGGDVSEAGFSRETNVALVPSFDVPSEFIDEDARQFRFSNHSTTDDHGMHLVGYYEKDGEIWYLIKDSSSGSRNMDENNKKFGYYFFSEDYVKLKMMGITVRKDAVKDLFKK